MRINKYLASCNMGSRRKVEQLLKDNLVEVNGKTVTSLATHVKNNDEVKVAGKKIAIETKNIYIMLNKPKGYISSVSDEQQRPTVLKLIKGVKERIYPVGRLDYNTEGLLILTNDGELTYKLTHPKNKIGKTYEVLTKFEPTVKQLNNLRNGVIIDGNKTATANVFKPVCNENGKFVTTITIYEGKNRQVRKMFETINLPLINLKRIKIGSLELKDLELGKYRFLKTNEINLLLGESEC